MFLLNIPDPNPPPCPEHPTTQLAQLFCLGFLGRPGRVRNPNPNVETLAIIIARQLGSSSSSASKTIVNSRSLVCGLMVSPCQKFKIKTNIAEVWTWETNSRILMCNHSTKRWLWIPFAALCQHNFVFLEKHLSRHYAYGYAHHVRALLCSARACSCRKWSSVSAGCRTARVNWP